jgi:hypothetical protein
MLEQLTERFGAMRINDRCRRFSLIAFLITASSWTTIGQPQGANSKTETRSSATQAAQLSPEAAEIADEIGVARLLKRLESQPADGSTMSLASLSIRQEITEKVLGASFDVDSVNAVIDTELVWCL